MANFNKVYLIGNLTRDPEVRSTPSGQTVVEFGLATNRQYRAGGPDGERREEVTFVDIAFWGRAGETIAQYLHKGDPIFIEGRLTFRTWEAKDGGGKRSKLSVTGENFQFLGGRRDGGAGGARSSSSASSFDQGGYDEQSAGLDEVPF